MASRRIWRGIANPTIIAALAVALALTGNWARAAGLVTLNGAGATFPYPLYSRWFSEYNHKHPDVRINYQAIGSGGGIAQVQKGTVDFGASDGPMTDQQIADTPFKLYHIPTVLGGVVPTYNIPGVNTELKFTGDVLADIFLG